jgi:hypothetical protein
METMTVQISFSDLWTYGEEARNRLPLSSLPRAYGHIHGRLSIIIAGRALPRLGYWGPDEVCLGSWAQELAMAVRTLSASPDSDYLYDEGEQGQPAYRFSRRGETVYVSVVDSQISDGVGDPGWQDVPSQYEEFCGQVEKFLGDLHEVVKAEAPSVAKYWRPSQFLRRT